MGCVVLFTAAVSRSDTSNSGEGPGGVSGVPIVRISPLAPCAVLVSRLGLDEQICAQVCDMHAKAGTGGVRRGEECGS